MAIIVEFLKNIPNFFSENNNFIMTIATMIVGIVAGWFPTLKKSYHRTLTVTVAIVNAQTLICPSGIINALSPISTGQ